MLPNYMFLWALWNQLPCHDLIAWLGLPNTLPKALHHLWAFRCFTSTLHFLAESGFSSNLDSNPGPFRSRFPRPRRRLLRSPVLRSHVRRRSRQRHPFVVGPGRTRRSRSQSVTLAKGPPRRWLVSYSLGKNGFKRILSSRTKKVFPIPDMDKTWYLFSF